MSLSPSGIDEPGSLDSYRKGWSAINTLLNKGASLSGREPHCAYLNLGDGSFADVSAHAGIDLPDDGRSLATVDWDHDGQLDLLFTNRTAPRLRFLLNRSVTDNRFVAFKLTATQGNRDAIGARLEVTAGGKVYRATLRAGDAFLAQSSKWMHFGLGGSEEVESLSVRWPSGETETFEIPAVDAFYRVTQGGGDVVRWHPPAGDSLQPAPFEAPPGTDAARIFMPARVPMPDATWTDFAGASHPLVPAGDRPRLVNLWAAWCAPCMVEFDEWKRHEADFERLGLEVVALSVDGLGGDGRSTPADAERKVEELALPFRTGRANEVLLGRLELVADALVDKHNSLPVPSSILLDKRGEVAAIYKGPVAFDTLARDVQLLEAPAKDLRFFATPFRGRWIEPPPRANPSRLVSNFVTVGDIADAETYLDRWVEARGPKQGRDQDVAESFYAVGGAYRSRGKLEKAVANYRDALNYSPDQPSIHLDLAVALAQLKRLREAVPHFASAVAANPNDDDTRRRLVLALVQSGQSADALPHLNYLTSAYPNDATAQLLFAKSLKSNHRAAEAVSAYRRSLQLRPGWALAANELAWMLATFPDESLRDGQEALRLAQVATGATGGKEPAVLDTLAAAQAEAGDFESARATARRAVEIANARGQTALAKLLEQRLANYESGTPFRDETK